MSIFKGQHRLIIADTAPGKAAGRCTCGKWKMSGYKTSVQNTHRQHVAEEAKKN